MESADIIQNAIDLFTQAGFGTLPRVAILSAVETVTSKIPSTIEAAALCKMADRGQITGGLLDGPLAFDNAIDMEAARIKGIKSEVAGRAQILVVPDLEAGNMLAKNLAYFAKADSAGIVLGARVPIVLTSRADSPRARMASCAVAALYADARRRTCSNCRSVTAMDTILVVNAGSSSVKFQVFAVEGEGELRRQIKGQMDGIGSRPRLRASGAKGEPLADRAYPIESRSGRSSGDGHRGRMAARRASHQPDGRRTSRRPWRPGLRPAGADRSWRGVAAGALSSHWRRCISRTIWRRSARS